MKYKAMYPLTHTKSRKVESPAIRSVRSFVKSEKGSEAVEMVASTAFICIMLMSLMMILTYAIQLNQVSYAAKRIVRGIEISGMANKKELEDSLGTFIHNKDALKLEIKADAPDGWYGGTDDKIQLRNHVVVTIEGSYPLLLANPGFGDNMLWELRLPIRVAVSGQVERYWRG